MSDEVDIRSKTERLVRILEESKLNKFRSPSEIAVAELELTDLSERILDEINSGLVNFKLIHQMVSPEYVN